MRCEWFDGCHWRNNFLYLCRVSGKQIGRATTGCQVGRWHRHQSQRQKHTLHFPKQSSHRSGTWFQSSITSLELVCSGGVGRRERGDDFLYRPHSAYSQLNGTENCDQVSRRWSASRWMRDLDLLEAVAWRAEMPEIVKLSLESSTSHGCTSATKDGNKDQVNSLRLWLLVKWDFQADV